MILRSLLKAIAVTATLLSLHCDALAQNDHKTAVQPLPFVSPLFGDNMVLQRGKANTIWGWSDPGDKVRIEIAGKHASGVAAADGRWQVKIQPPPAGGPYVLTIEGHQTVELQNVLVGDVWLSRPEELHLTLGDKTSIPLTGKWKGQLSRCASAPSYANWFRELARDAVSAL